MTKTKVEVFTPRNRLAEKAQLREEPAEDLISQAESAIAALGNELGPQLDPEIRELRQRLVGAADSDSSALGALIQDAQQLGEVAYSLGYSDIGQILASLQQLLAGASDDGLNAKTEELARLHVDALGKLSRDCDLADGQKSKPHPIAGELERATQRLIATPQ